MTSIQEIEVHCRNAVSPLNAIVGRRFGNVAEEWTKQLGTVRKLSIQYLPVISATLLLPSIDRVDRGLAYGKRGWTSSMEVDGELPNVVKAETVTWEADDGEVLVWSD